MNEWLEALFKLLKEIIKWYRTKWDDQREKTEAKLRIIVR